MSEPSKPEPSKYTINANRVYISEQDQHLHETTDNRQLTLTLTDYLPTLTPQETKTILQEATTDPTFRQRLTAALTAGTLETLKSLLPPLGIALETINAYRNPNPQ